MSLKASCHCGATQMVLPDHPSTGTSCNCSFCDRTGAVWAYFKPEEVSVRAEAESTYSAGGVNQHHFCGRCGMQTWGESPDWASAYNTDGSPKPGYEVGTTPAGRIVGVNLRLVEGLDWSKVEVQQIDGRNSW